MDSHVGDHTARTVELYDPGPAAVDIAHQLDELVRALNYALMPRHPRLDCAAVYSVLGSLQAALSNLPQACGQLVAHLARQQAAGVLDVATGFPHAGQPEAAVEEARFRLRAAAGAADLSSAAFGRAQSAISGLSQDDTAPTPVRSSRRHASHAPAVDRSRVVEP